MDEWEAQNIFTRSFSSDILGILTMGTVQLSLNPQNNALNLPFFIRNVVYFPSYINGG